METEINKIENNIAHLNRDITQLEEKINILNQ